MNHANIGRLVLKIASAQQQKMIWKLMKLQLMSSPNVMYIISDDSTINSRIFHSEL